MRYSALEDDAHRWVEDIRAGREAAFKELFYAYYPKLCSFAAGYVGSHDLAREVVQDVFLIVWERRVRWEVHGSLRAYLYRAVRNRALNALRREKNARAAMDRLERSRATFEHPTPQTRLYYEELSEAVQKAVQALPERRRRVFVLHRQHGLSYAEIAQAMGITPKTVENQMGRALKFLRQRLVHFHACESE